MRDKIYDNMMTFQ